MNNDLQPITERQEGIEAIQMLGEVRFEEGDRVVYFYTHHVNSKASFINSRMGLLIRRKQYKKKFLADWNPSKIWVVKIDGNKTLSYINETDLEMVHKKDIFYCNKSNVTSVAVMKDKCEYQCSWCANAVRR